MDITAFELLSDAIIILSKDKKILYCNSVAQHMLKYIKVGDHCPNIYSICNSCPIDIVLEEQRHINIYDVKINDIHVCMSMNPITFEGQEAIIEIFRDVSKVISYMEEVHKQKDFIQNVLNSVIDGIIVFDKDSKVVDINKSAYKLLCSPEKSLIGIHIKEVFGISKEELPVNGKRADIYIQTNCGKQKASCGISELKDGNFLVSFYIIPEKDLFLSFSDENFISKSPAFKKILDITKSVASSNVNILIEGETGTGKTLLAKYIHYLSDRRDKPFIKVNCAAIPETLLEAELFGYEKGAFTGAIKTKIGKVELANEGTLFLDEIGDMPLSLQSKILQLIQDKEIERIGDTKIRKVDVRIIAATNKNLKSLINQGKFREDLYYRLNVVSLKLPPLRERKEDIPTFVNLFIKKYNEIHKKNIKSMSPEAIKHLMDYDFPGNIRELENIIERAVVISPKSIIELEALPEDVYKSKKTDISDDEKETILRLLKEYNYNKTAVAKALNMHRTTLWRKLKEYNLE
ncbi:MAG: sigma 54-interacting transcriptional regulator [Candidatus Parvarchaeum sp.]|nr:sigma 54-interacting transcriptional regulator [Candidatus Parvarchaeum tengchongense]